VRRAAVDACPSHPGDEQSRFAFALADEFRPSDRAADALANQRAGRDDRRLADDEDARGGAVRRSARTRARADGASRSGASRIEAARRRTVGRACGAAFRARWNRRRRGGDLACAAGGRDRARRSPAGAQNDAANPIIAAAGLAPDWFAGRGDPGACDRQ
jgi:hypothetical protein